MTVAITRRELEARALRAAARSKDTAAARRACVGDGRLQSERSGTRRRPLPRYSPELNPVQNIWQFLRQNYLANSVYDTYQTIVDACCAAWNALVAAPDAIRSIASRAWAEPVTA